MASDRHGSPGLPPLLRWAGSKRQLSPNLARFVQRHSGTYFEPFAGSAALFFRTTPGKAVLGDTQHLVITTYETVRSEPHALAHRLARFNPSPSAYYQARADLRQAGSAVDLAALFLIVNRYCFNGLFRTNRLGQFNVPFGGSRNGTLPSEAQLNAYASALAQATLVNADFEAVLATASAGDFAYLDPPYVSAERWRAGHHYAPEDFRPEDLPRLRSVMVDLTRRGVGFALTYRDGPEGHRLATGFSVDRVETRRTIAAKPPHRHSQAELVISNQVPIPTPGGSSTIRPADLPNQR